MADTNKILKGHEAVSLRLDPAPGVATRFSEWQAETKAMLEAGGMIVTDVEGCMFHGHYDPTTVDPDGILG